VSPGKPEPEETDKVFCPKARLILTEKQIARKIAFSLIMKLVFYGLDDEECSIASVDEFASYLRLWNRRPCPSIPERSSQAVLSGKKIDCLSGIWRKLRLPLKKAAASAAALPNGFPK